MAVAKKLALDLTGAADIFKRGRDRDVFFRRVA